jgi:hypothetical protein
MKAPTEHPWLGPIVPRPHDIRIYIRDLTIVLDLAPFPLPEFEERRDVLNMLLPVSIDFYGDDDG